MKIRRKLKGWYKLWYIGKDRQNSGKRIITDKNLKENIVNVKWIDDNTGRNREKNRQPDTNWR